MDTLAAMRTFVTIVDSGSLTAAADVLDRSQPAIVRSLATLEKHLGAKLLQRTTRRMSLTPEGRDYLERCRQILADVNDAERAVGQDEADPRGQIRVTAPVQFGERHVAPGLCRFLERYPNVEVDLFLLDRNVDLVEEGIDVALRIGPLADSDLVALPVGEVRRLVCASPALIEKTGIPATPDELAGVPCIRISNLARPGRWSFRIDGRDRNVRINGRFRSNQIAGAIQACRSGAGFGQFLSYQVCDELASGALVRVLADFEVDPLPVSLVYPGGRLVSARQRALLSFLKADVREHVFLRGH